MKIVRLFCVIIASLIFAESRAQTATDFVTNDCDNNPHHLFAELDAGKVVIIAWAMPCGSCIGPILSAYNISQTFAASNPGKILFYLADDYANSSCNLLINWANQYSIGPNIIAFSSSAINMNHYGGAGMPKVVVLAGGNHQVVFNENNTLNTSNFQNAMNQALLLSSSGTNSFEFEDAHLYPNPASEMVTVTFNHNVPTIIQLYNSTGMLIESYNVPLSGEKEFHFSVKGLSSGIYTLVSFDGYSVMKNSIIVLNEIK